MTTLGTHCVSTGHAGAAGETESSERAPDRRSIDDGWSGHGRSHPFRLCFAHYRVMTDAPSSRRPPLNLSPRRDRRVTSRSLYTFLSMAACFSCRRLPCRCCLKFNLVELLYRQQTRSLKAQMKHKTKQKIIIEKKFTNR